MPLRRLHRPPVRCRGFTLIELLTVLTIMGMLIAIFLPGLRGARRNAHRMLCAYHLRGVGRGLDLYAETYNDWYPTAESSCAGTPSAIAPSAGKPSPQNWWENNAFLELLDLTPNPQGRSILTCPADREPDLYVDGSVKGCWVSYGANTSAFGMRRGRSKRPRHRSQVQFPAKAMGFCDVRSPRNAPHAVGWQGCVVRNFAFRHNEHCAVVYVDTHVDWIRPEDVPLGNRAWEDPFWGNIPCFDKP
ncbi:MAG: type II secretion system protein [Phycisphaerae bacterium]